MSYWKKFNEAISHWPLSIATVIIAEANIAAVAYDIGARPVCGIGSLMAREEVAKMLLEERGVGGIMYDEVMLGEFGVSILKPMEEVAGVDSISEDPLLFLYSAEVDERDTYWSGLVFSLLFDCGLGSLERCSKQADDALRKARRDMYAGGCI